MSQRRGSIQYLQSIIDKRNPNEAVQQALKKRQNNIQSNLQNGELNIQQSNQDIATTILKTKDINPFQSHYKAFFFQSDLQKNHQRLQIFKRIKQQYSKQKTAIVVQEVEKKIKQWSQRQEGIKRRKKLSDQKHKRKQKEQVDNKKQAQIEEVDKAKERHVEEVRERVRKMQARNAERREFIKQTSMKSLDTSRIAPKYLEMEQQFLKIQQKMKQEREKILREKRETMVLDKQELKQHSKRYAELLKKKDEERKQKEKTHKRLSIQERTGFDELMTNRKAEKEQGQAKVRRMKEFQKKVKSMRIVVKDKSVENGVEKVKQKKSGVQSVSQLPSLTSPDRLSPSPSKQKRALVLNADGKQLGNDYLQKLRQNLKSKPKPLSSSRKASSLPSIKPSYPNYLTQIKPKLRPVDQVTQLKRACLSQAEALNQLNKKSQVYEEAMMRKIGELRKTNRYEQSVAKEKQIDQAYSRYIKTRLDCLKVGQDKNW